MAKDKEEKPKKREVFKTQEDLLKSINKDYGAGSIMQGRNTIVKVDSFPTNIATIDRALGCGGVPEGRIFEIFGLESSGKTTTALHFIAACQKHFFPKKSRHGVAAFIDAEHAFDPVWAGKCGVDVDKLMFSQPNSGEEAFDIVERLVESGLVDFIVIDSVSALVPQVELDGEITDSNIGVQARLMSKGLRKINPKVNKTKTTVCFLNQIRHKIGVMFGNPETTSGGLALKFYASVRAQINKGSPIKDGSVTVAFRPTFKIIKNKVAPPFTTGEYEISLGTPERPVCGLDEMVSLIEVGDEMKLFVKKGNYITFDGTGLGNGQGMAAAALRAKPEVAKVLREKIYCKLLENVHPITESEGEDEQEPAAHPLSDDILDQVRDGDD
jgi:recombination protein RecA